MALAITFGFKFSNIIFYFLVFSLLTTSSNLKRSKIVAMVLMKVVDLNSIFPKINIVKSLFLSHHI